MAGRHYAGEVGTLIRLDCGMDISAATSTFIFCDKPDSSRVVWPATVYNLRYLQYAVVMGDLADAGTYRVQAGLTMGDWVGRGETATFDIIPLFN